MQVTPSPRARGFLPGFAASADLGGLSLPGGGVTASRRVVRADVPAGLSSAEQEAARAFGITTVVDLRSADEARATPHPLADLPGYQALPLIDPAAEAHRDAAREPTHGHVYAASLTRNAGPIATILTALAQAPPGPAMVCCAAGRDRTGMVAALLLDLTGVDRAVIAADHAVPDRDCAAGGSSVLSPGRPLAVGSFGSRAADASTGAAPQRRGAADILMMLEHTTLAHGGTAGYLRWLGLPAHDVAALRARLVP